MFFIKGIFDCLIQCNHLRSHKCLQCTDTGMTDSVLAGYLTTMVFACAYNYVMHIFVAARYLMVLMMELVGPIAVVCLLNDNTRSSFLPG